MTLQSGQGSPRVVVRLDGKKCPVGGYTIDGTVIRGICEQMDGIVPAHQDDLDKLGARLRAELDR